MSEIFVVNVASGGYNTTQSSYYHRTESEAQESYDECMESVGDDPTSIELIRLDIGTLDATTIHFWEGTADDIARDMRNLHKADEEIMVGQP